MTDKDKMIEEMATIMEEDYGFSKENALALSWSFFKAGIRPKGGWTIRREMVKGEDRWVHTIEPKQYEEE